MKKRAPPDKMIPAGPASFCRNRSSEGLRHKRLPLPPVPLPRYCFVVALCCCYCWSQLPPEGVLQQTNRVLCPSSPQKTHQILRSGVHLQPMLLGFLGLDRRNSLSLFRHVHLSEASSLAIPSTPKVSMVGTAGFRDTGSRVRGLESQACQRFSASGLDVGVRLLNGC